MYVRTRLVSILILGISFHVFTIKTDEVNAESNVTTPLNNSRRILQGKETGATRPYMVWLQGSRDSTVTYPNWLCGGVIIHKFYVLTSAACIENAENFFVISGTHRWTPNDDIDECIRNTRLKAIWKCVPKSYTFDGKESDNILWMINDIAVVKVEEGFNFDKRVRGCDFIPKPIPFNNITEDLEKPGTVASIAGWGTQKRFSELGRVPNNSPVLLEAATVVISRSRCKTRWPKRYHNIIDDYMICSKDNADFNLGPCADELDCKGKVYEDYDEDETRRAMSQNDVVHSAHHEKHNTRRDGMEIGGFCENDHGGPLVAGQGKSACVIGIVSACQTQDLTRLCHGPYLYTSVWKQRRVIECAIGKDALIGRRFDGHLDACRGYLEISKTKLRFTHFKRDNKSQNGTNKDSSDKGGQVFRTRVDMWYEDVE